MTTVLQIHSSLFGEDGASRRISDDLVTRIGENLSINQIIKHDLAQEQTPHLDAEWIAALNTPVEQRSPEQQRRVDFSDRLISEVKQADILVIGAPMYNFSVPSVLKAWFDHITRAGVTFTYAEGQQRGLLTGKTAYVVSTRGGLHKDKPTDAQIPFIKTILNFIGIDDIHVIYAEGLNMGGEHRDQGFANAQKAIEDLVA